MIRKNRRSLRLKGYDYAQTGTYFVTICTPKKQSLFGEVVGGEMVLNDVGRIIQMCWSQIPNHFPQVVLYPFQNETRISNRVGSIFLYVTTAIWKGIRSRFYFGMGIFDFLSAR